MCVCVFLNVSMMKISFKCIYDTSFRVHQQAFMLIYVYISIYSYVYVYICIYMQSYVLYVQVDNHVDTCGCCVIYWAGLRGACWLVTSTALGMSCMCRQSVPICVYHDLLHAHTHDLETCTHAKKEIYIRTRACK